MMCACVSSRIVSSVLVSYHSLAWPFHQPAPQFFASEFACGVVILTVLCVVNPDSRIVLFPELALTVLLPTYFAVVMILDLQEIDGALV